MSRQFVAEEEKEKKCLKNDFIILVMHKTIYRHELIENPRSVKKYLGQGNGRYEVNMAGGGGRQIGMIYFYYLFGKMDYG